MSRENVFQVSLPKSAGSVEVNTKLVPEEILAFALEHGFRQKLGDIAVNMYVKSKRPEPKDGDVLFDTADELAKAIREKGTDLIARWYSGEWNLEGGGTRSDPVGGEMWSILFSKLDIPTTKRAEARKLGMAELAFRVYELKAGNKRPTGKKAQEEAAVKLLGQIRAKAESILNTRDELAVDL